MGIYDREYYREEQRSFGFGPPSSMVLALVIVNGLLWLVNGLLAGNGVGPITGALVLYARNLLEPWMWWRLLTYGFVHDPTGFGHVFGNMLALYFLGQIVENALGRWEFLRFYLVALVVGGVVWSIISLLMQAPGLPLLGASGAVTAVIILFALKFPRMTVLLLFVLPMPAWLLGIFWVLYDIFGALGISSQSHVAFVVHLAGAGFALAYFLGNWNFGRLFSGRFDLRRFRPRWPGRPRLRVHPVDEEEVADEPADLNAEVDRILEKISKQGEASLTARERNTLQDASRRYQRRRGG